MEVAIIVIIVLMVVIIWAVIKASKAESSTPAKPQFTPTRTIASIPPDFPIERSWRDRVVGESHWNYDGSSRQEILTRCQEGELLVFVREPDNEYDPNAIAVCRFNGEQIGYLDRDLAADLAPEMDEGYGHFGALEKVVGGTPDKPSRGAVITVFKVSEKEQSTSA